MESKTFMLPPMASKYILRSTGEEVEVVAFNQPDNGARNNEDWVTYIDSKGAEHIKEHLNIQLDFKAQVNDVWSKMLDMPAFNKMPSTKNQRIFDVAKELVKGGSRVSTAVSVARQLVDEVGEN